MNESISLGGRRVSGFTLGATEEPTDEVVVGVSPTYAAIMTGATAGLAVLVFKGPAWGSVLAFAGVSVLTKFGIENAAA